MISTFFFSAALYCVAFWTWMEWTWELLRSNGWRLLVFWTFLHWEFWILPSDLTMIMQNQMRNLDMIEHDSPQSHVDLRIYQQPSTIMRSLIS